MSDRRLAWAIFLAVMLLGGYANWSDEQARLDEQVNIRDALYKQYQVDEAAAIKNYTGRSKP